MPSPLLKNNTRHTSMDKCWEPCAKRRAVRLTPDASMIKSLLEMAFSFNRSDRADDA